MKGIYKITSPTKKIYIGQSHDIIKRWKRYKNGCPQQLKLHNSLIKHGLNSHVFEVACELPEDISQEIMDKYEDLYLESYKSYGFSVMNLRNAGSRGLHSDETKDRMKGRVLSENSINKIKNSLLGHIVSDTTRTKISEKLKLTFINNPELKVAQSIRMKGKISPKKGLTIGRIKPYKNIPSKNELELLSKSNTIKKMALIYNVSGTTIKNWIERLEVSYINKQRHTFNSVSAKKAYLLKKSNCSNNLI